MYVCNCAHKEEESKCTMQESVHTIVQLTCNTSTNMETKNNNWMQLQLTSFYTSLNIPQQILHVFLSLLHCGQVSHDDIISSQQH